MILTIICLFISLSQSPLFSLILVISLSFMMSSQFFWGQNFVLFFIWNLVYVGGMMIVFTYVVFFSNYSFSFKLGGWDFFSIFFFLFLFKKFFGEWMNIFLNCNILPENFMGFSFFGESSSSLIMVIFFIISVVLIILLSILKSTNNQFLLSMN